MPRSCGVIGLEGDSIQWRLWAPRASRVELVLVDGDRRRPVAMASRERGRFEHVRPGVLEGQRYAFRLNGGPERPDPASLWQPDGVHRPSSVLRPERFAWTDSAWKGVPRHELVFYELHVGTFTREGTFDAIIARLPELKDLGVTAIELMPLAQFPGTRGWGYDAVHPFAPQNSYGGPHGLQRLVDACHARGLAIFLDVVYNHLGPEGNYLNDFGPYFSDRYKTTWGWAFNYDSAGCDFARAFVLDNVRLWLEEYHFDGLRLDAVHAIYDFSAHHILQEIKETADEIASQTGRVKQIVAESSLNDVRILRDYGLDVQWNDDFHHAVHVHLTGERQGYYADFGTIEDFPRLFEGTFLYDGRYSVYRDRKHGGPVGDLPGDRFVVSIQNHDQIGNRARGDRLSTLVEPAAQRLAASLMLLSPHLPLLFMGEEYGETAPFLYFCSFLDPQLAEAVRKGRKEEFASFAWQGVVPDPNEEATFGASRLSWSWPEGTLHAGLRRLYQDLLAARRRWPALKDFTNRSAKLTGDVLRLVRGEMQAFFNLSREERPLAHTPGPGEAMLFTSEDARYMGRRSETDPLDRLHPNECAVWGAARAAGASPHSIPVR